MMHNRPCKSGVKNPNLEFMIIKPTQWQSMDRQGNFQFVKPLSMTHSFRDQRVIRREHPKLFRERDLGYSFLPRDDPSGTEN
jgi:hypothetical protein